MNFNPRGNYLLIIILLLAGALRLYALDRGDTVNDEVFYAFRGFGWMDYDHAESQPTPLEWFDPNTVLRYCATRQNGDLKSIEPYLVSIFNRMPNKYCGAGGKISENYGIPFWTRLSFHDHPPLVFLLERVSMKIFGDSTWAERLPSALFGIASVYLTYLLGALIFSETAGLIAAAFLAVGLNNVYISRTGMQEACVIFFMLLASYLFLKALKNDKYFIWTGIALGLGFLAKYNVFILVPVFLAYLIIFRRDIFRKKYFWIGTTIAFVLFSPVLFYNAMLYGATGHFDFQFSYIFGQHPAEWQSTPGKDIGTLGDRIKNFIPRMASTNSWLFLGLFAVSLIFFRNSFLFLMFGFLVLLLLFIGPSYRFLTMLTPWMALSIGCAAEYYFVRSRVMLGGLMFLIFAFEIFYAYNNQIAYYPLGPDPWLASKVRYENYNWGYNELGKYLETELQGKMPALTFYNKYKFLDDAEDKALEQEKNRALEPYPALIVYYGNFDDGPRLWILDRLHIYHGWPIITFDTYMQFLRENGNGYYAKAGFRNYYFIMQTNIVPSREFTKTIGDIPPIPVKNPRSDTAFMVYRKDY